MNENKKKYIQELVTLIRVIWDQRIHDLGVQGFSTVAINNKVPINIVDPTSELFDLMCEYSSIATDVKIQKRQIEITEKDWKDYIFEAFIQTIQERRIQQGGLSIFMSILQGGKQNVTNI